jgi:gliding motility-associated protein GldL
MASITDIVESSGWKNFMAKLYGIGASVVIIGALFKIQHWKGSGLFLTLGLCTEATIFFFSAFEPLHEELDWTLVYPELAGMSDEDELEHFKESALATGERPIEKVETLLGDISLDEKVIRNLGDGLNKLNETVMNIADISNASVATKAFLDNLQNAADSVNSLKDTYSNTTETIKESANNLAGAYFQSADEITKSGSDVANAYQQIADSIKSEQNTISEGSKAHEQHLEELNKNLAALNAVYELQIKGGNEHVKGALDIYSGLEEMIKQLRDSVDETNKYKEEITKLKDNLSSLNTIYGNMLSAMNVMIKK